MRTYDKTGTWGITPSILDDAKDGHDFIQRLPTLGFIPSQELTCRTGNVQLFLRQRPTGRKTLPFDFCCVVYIAGFLHPVLLADLPDVLRFLREIDAHPKTTPLVADNFAEIKDSLEILADRLENVPVSIPHLSQVNTTLQQVILLLQEIKTTLSTGKSSSRVVTESSVSNA